MSFEQFRGRALSPRTAAQLVDCSVSQIHRWISGGEISATKLGYRATRIDGDSLADFLTRRFESARPPRGKEIKRGVV